MTNFKTLPDEFIDQCLKGIKFKTQPYRHQKVTIVWAANTGKRLAGWHGIGTGKSLSALYVNQIWRSTKILVVCPNTVVEVWENQITEHTDLKYCLLTGSAKKRKELLTTQADIYVINFEGLQVLFGRRIRLGNKSCWHIDPKAIREAKFDGLIIDECHGISNPDTHQTKVCRQLSILATYVIEMTGTPISTGEINLHSQYDVLDGGKTLGVSHRKFLQTHFQQNYWGSWEIREGEREKILDRLAPVTLRYSREECLDLPEKVYTERRVDMTIEQKRLIKRIVEDPDIDILHKGMKLSQVTGGFLKTGDNIVRLKKNPKLDELVEFLKELEGRAIVFHSFVEEGKMIEKRLDKAGISYGSIRAERKTLDVFRGGAKVLVAHPSSGGVGLNLQEANTVVFYSNGCYGAAVRDQAEGRIWRMGQESKCLMVDLLVRDSIDESRLERTRDQAEMAARVTEYVRKWTGS